MKKSVSTVSRRSVLAGAAGIVPMVFKSSRAAKATSDSLTITMSGGSYQEKFARSVAGPFTEETGIKVIFAPVVDLAKIKAMQLTGNVEWDIVVIAGTGAAAGAKEGLFDELDISSMLDLKDLSVLPTKYIVTFDSYACGIGWDPKKYGPGKHPVNFAEFFDLKKFPGRRAMRPSPDGTLEIALLADGVALKDIYPLNVDRAFKALERIKSNVAWTATAPQTVSLVQTGEVDFSITYNNRVKATNEAGGGVPLAFSFEQNLIFPDPLVVPKGAPHKESAKKFLAYLLRPEVQARLEDETSQTPVSKKALTMMSIEARKWLPDMNNPNNLLVNSAYWADNHEAVWPRFQEWLRT
ncbi:ABC transporter substrate-binding protein [Bradyrhizobium zhanjiangense]|nr:ABC transporter substrate-binding protein [Bradyrhizobium zhanjiangense]